MKRHAETALLKHILCGMDADETGLYSAKKAQKRLFERDFYAKAEFSKHVLYGRISLQSGLHGVNTC